MTEPQTSRRVSITMELATQLAPGVALAAVTERLPLTIREQLVSTSCHTYDLAEGDDDPRPEFAYFVLHGNGDPAEMLIGDNAEALRKARSIGGLVAELPLVADYSGASLDERGPAEPASEPSQTTGSPA